MARKPLQAQSASSPRGGARELTCVSFVLLPDGRAVPPEELTKEERECWQQDLRERLSETMSAYYAQHPTEFAALRSRR